MPLNSKLGKICLDPCRWIKFSWALVGLLLNHFGRLDFQKKIFQNGGKEKIKSQYSSMERQKEIQGMLGQGDLFSTQEEGYKLALAGD